MPLFKIWKGGAWVNGELTKTVYLWIQFQWFGRTIQKCLFKYKVTRQLPITPPKHRGFAAGGGPVFMTLDDHKRNFSKKVLSLPSLAPKPKVDK